MRTLGIIPARGGSKGIPRKNLADLGGRPILAWTTETALASSLVRVVLSTDDPEIASAGRELGVEVPFMRPAALATDEARSIDVVLHALDALDDMFDAAMLLQPTTPFRAVADIEGSIEMLTTSNATSVISVTSVGEHHPARMKYLTDGVLIDPPFAEELEGMQRQDLSPLFIRNGAIYLTGHATLRARTFKGALCHGWVMPSERSINIDQPFDLLVARAILRGGGT